MSEGKGGAAACMRAYLLVVDPNGGVRADAFEPEKIAQPRLFVHRDSLPINRRSMKIAVTKTTVAVVVVPVVRDVHCLPVNAVPAGSPVLIEQDIVSWLPARFTNRKDGALFGPATVRVQNNNIEQ